MIATKTTRRTPRQSSRPARGEAMATAAAPDDARERANAAQARSPGDVVVTPQGRMIVTPARALIPEAQFQAMTRRTPQLSQPAVQVSRETQRLRKLIGSIESLVEAEPNGTNRRRAMRPVFLQAVLDQMRAGVKITADEAVAPLRVLEDPITPKTIIVSVELGAEWIARGKALGWKREEAEGKAASSAVDWVGKLYPEKAAKLAAHARVVRNAVCAWARGAGRPTKGGYQGSKWDAIAALCKLAGIHDHGSETIQKAWQRSGPK
jgi:hypothetical protein